MSRPAPGIAAIRALPKVSLHDHLDGAVRPATILELADRAAIAVPAATADDLAEWFVRRSDSGSLPAYLETFSLTTAVMQTTNQLQRIGREYVEDLVADGVVYGEVRWAPEQHLAGGLALEDAVAAVQTGIDDSVAAAAARGHDIRVGQVLSAMRQNDRAMEIAQLAVANRDRGVVGFDIAGPEDGFPPSRLQAVFDYLAGEFLPVTVHAGEAAGLGSIRSALIDGRALRLGHGVRIAEDIDVVSERGEDVFVSLGRLAQWVRDREITLELSPTSNLHTAAIRQWGNVLADHPFDLLHQLGFSVTVNTDNRTQSATTLTAELAALAKAFDYDLDDLREFQLNAAAGAFLPLDEKEELVEILGG